MEDRKDKRYKRKEKERNLIYMILTTPSTNGVEDDSEGAAQKICMVKLVT